MHSVPREDLSHVDGRAEKLHMLLYGTGKIEQMINKMQFVFFSEIKSFFFYFQPFILF